MTTRIPETRDVVQWQNSTINGRIERKLLEGVGMFDIDLGSEGLMYPPAAKAFKEMVAAAAEDGVVLSARRFYRTREDQEAKWLHAPNNPNAIPPIGSAIVAPPGTSNHGEALALDFSISSFTSPQYVWLRNHAAHFKFDNNDAPSEPWHWTYRGGYVPKGDDDVTIDEFTEGFETYIEKYRARDGEDPGAPNEDKPPHFKKGWNLARFAAINPKPTPPGDVSGDFAPKVHSHTGEVTIT
jgi:hypothetical protein